MPIKLIHIADVLLDASFAEAHMTAAAGAQQRHRLREVLQETVRRAMEWPADALLIAGNLFDGARVTRDTLAFLSACFEEAAPLPIVAAPGPADPLAPDSPYLTEPWPDNVTVCGAAGWTAQPVPDLGVVVHAYAWNQDSPRHGALPALTLEGGARENAVLLAHTGAGPEMRARTIQQLAGLRPLYGALGGPHTCGPCEPEGGRLFFSGAPEPHGFHEPGTHHRLEATLDLERGELDVRERPSAKTVYQIEDVDCANFTHARQVAAAISAFLREGHPAQALRVRLRGPRPEKLTEALAEAKPGLADQAAFLELLDRTHEAGDYAALAQDHSTTQGAFVRRINAAIQDAPDEATHRLLTRARALGITAYGSHGLTMPVPGEGGAR